MIFNGTQGPTTNLTDRLTPLQCFNLLFFTTTVWEFLVNKTNQYAIHKKPKHTGRRSLYCNWRPVTIEEMKAFVGIILNMGITQLQKVNDYWSTSFTCNIPFFRQTFSRDRFFQGIISVHDQTLLAENGGPLLLTKDWALSLLRRMGFVKRKATTKANQKMTKEKFQEEKKSYLDQIVAVVVMNDVPHSLIINLDQTGMKLVPAGDWTMAPIGKQKGRDYWAR